MNENYQLVIQEAGDPLFRELGKILQQNVVTFTGKMPYDEMFTKEN
jgi:hypothetical protein